MKWPGGLKISEQNRNMEVRHCIETWSDPMKRVIVYFSVLLMLAGQWAHAQQPDIHSLYEPQVFEGMPCRVMKPLDFNAKRHYPVIVSLHGAGGRGTDNAKQLKDWNRQLAEEDRRRKFPCYVVAPQAKELWNAEHLNKIKSLIKTLSSVDMDRVYILGHSMGGHGTYIFIQLDSEYFAAAAPSAGSGKKTTEDFIAPAKIRDVPIWAFHGDKDGVCPIQKDQKVFSEIKTLGGNMKLTTWAGDGHGVSGKMIPGASNGTTEFSSDRCDKEPDFLTWLFSQSRELKEIDERIGEIQDLMERLEERPELDQTRREAQYLTTTIARLREVRKVRGTLFSLADGTAEPLHDRLEKRVDLLEAQVDADEELVEMIVGVIEAPAEDAEDMEVEIGELRRELENQSEASGAVPMTEPSGTRDLENSQTLKSGRGFITQSWSQERRFDRPYFVSVPRMPDGATKLPVFLFLHGNGGDAKEAMIGFTRHRRAIAAKYIMVFAQGYRESWNIVSERSKADDLRFIEAIVLKLAKFDNVESNNFTIMGASNGAAMVNQLAIESRLSNIRNYISGVSPLNVWQYDGEYFRAKGEDNNYRVAVTPAKGKRLMNISGVHDKLVPYRGGFSNVIPAKDGKLAFVDAEESTHIWARQMGYDGDQLATPTASSEAVDVFSYLDGDVVHCKVNNEGHGAVHGISEEYLLQFLQGGD